jgi:acyl-CoA thioesterase-1
MRKTLQNGDDISNLQVRFEGPVDNPVAAPGGKRMSVAGDVSFIPSPRVLLIGDSISIGYTPVVQHLLKGRAEVVHHEGNGATTRHGLEHLDEWLGTGRWACIHFNFGLHDVVGESGQGCTVPEGEYADNLRLLVERLQRTGARLVWASTTPVPEVNARKRLERDVCRYNDVARALMAELGVAVNDLHGAMLPRQGELQKRDNVHFTAAGSEFLGERVAVAVSEALGLVGFDVADVRARGLQERPVVLCLGDSNAAGWVPALRPRVRADLLVAAESGMTVGFDNLGSPDLNMLKRLDRVFLSQVVGLGRRIREVLVLLGTNDSKSEYGGLEKTVVANFRNLVLKLRSYPWPGDLTPEVTLVTPPPYGEAGADGADGKYAGGARRVAALVPALKALGEELNCEVIDIHTPMQPNIAALSPDGVHFGEAGYAEIARLIALGMDPDLHAAGPG